MRAKADTGLTHILVLLLLYFSHAGCVRGMLERATNNSKEVRTEAAEWPKFLLLLLSMSTTVNNHALLRSLPPNDSLEQTDHRQLHNCNFCLPDVHACCAFGCPPGAHCQQPMAEPCTAPARYARLLRTWLRSPEQ